VVNGIDLAEFQCMWVIIAIKRTSSQNYSSASVRISLTLRMDMSKISVC